MRALCLALVLVACGSMDEDAGTVADTPMVGDTDAGFVWASADGIGPFTAGTSAFTSPAGRRRDERSGLVPDVHGR